MEDSPWRRAPSRFRRYTLQPFASSGAKPTGKNAQTGAKRIPRFREELDLSIVQTCGVDQVSSRSRKRKSRALTTAQKSLSFQHPPKEL